MSRIPGALLVFLFANLLQAQNFDLRIYQFGIPYVKPGLPFPLVISYDNIGSVPATGVTFTLTAPQPILRAPQNCTIDGNRATCAIGTLEPLKPGSLAFELLAPDISAHTFDVTATITAAEGDAAPADNSRTAALHTFRTFYVTSTADSGADTLRGAIDALNATCDRPCLIAFRIPSAGQKWQTIRLASPLPRVRAEQFVSIDGTTQRDLVGDTNPDGPEIEITGSQGNGLETHLDTLTSIRGLAINGFPGYGLILFSRGTISENYIGTDPTGERAVPNERGIVLHALAVIEKNVISGNRRSGIFIAEGLGSQILNNVIGLNARVNAPLGNGASGIYTAARNTIIQDNYIGFNAHFGVAIVQGTAAVTMAGNSFQANGQTAIDYGLDGVITGLPPEITSVRVENGRTIIEGSLPSVGFVNRVDVFANDAPDPSGFGEGQYFLGLADVDSAGKFRFVYDGDLRGKWVTALQTYGILVIDFIERSTGEFSRAVEVR